MIAEERFSKWDGSVRWLQTLKAPLALKGNPHCILGVSMDVTERKRNAERQVLLSRVLDVLNQPKGKNDTVREVAQLVKDHFEFAAVSIRFQDRADFPYYVALGLPDDFVEDDKHLFLRDKAGAPRVDEMGKVMLRCACGGVLGGREIKGVGVTTGYGSFCTNDSSKIPLSAEIGGGQTWGDVLCVQRGYKSIALIPLRCGGRVVGLLQLHDPRENQFTTDLIEFLEGIAASVGVALTRIAVEEALRVTDTAIASSSGGIGFADLHGRVTYVNKACLDLLGYSSPEEMLGKRVDSFWRSKEELAPLKAALRKDGRWLGELTARKKDGTPIAIHVSTNMVTNKDGKFVCVMGSFTDLTAIRQLKAQLTRSERLAATGKLAASVAHQINSPLQAIAVLLGSLRDRFPEDPVFTSNVELLHGAFNSIRDIVRNLLDLSRPARARKEPANINNAIRKTASLVRAHLDGSKIKLSLELDDDLPPVMASSEELGQVFLNLIKNAMEAITDPPKRKGKRKPNAVEQGRILVRSAKENDEVVITVADNGPGIAVEDLEHVFDPFYTMKKRMGIGMGLFICHSIVENHNGTIEVENAPEGGAVFSIRLPSEKF
jgi:PAS domain S-box-containing protein